MQINIGMRSLAALALGLAAGAGVQAAHAPALTAAAHALAPIGTLWLSALKMTLVPLIFALVATGVSTWGGGGTGGRVIGGAVALCGALLLLSAGAGAGLTALALQVWPVDPNSLAFLTHAGGLQGQPQIPTIADQLTGLIPANPVAAAADGAMAPLVVFALLFGLALTRIDEARRQGVRTLLQGTAEAMMVIVGWVLMATPLGVFVLALGLGVNTGLGAVGVLAQALMACCLLPATGIAICYLIACIGGRIGPVRFARAVLAPQAMAAGTTSSMACLPAMIEAAQGPLGLERDLAGAVLPLAVSTFRFGNVIMISGAMLFVARASGAHPSLVQVAIACLVVVVTNIGIVGLPAAAVIYAAMAPAFQAIGAPLAFLPLFIAMGAIPDVFDTVCNVTADLTVAVLMRRFTARALSEAGVLPPLAAPAH